tara:strand:- start:707 stop:967 length:261 start_codon:yes stop_codon:yes gene_type:complete
MEKKTREQYQKGSHECGVLGVENQMVAKKRKSTVNKAGNYTKPAMRKRLFEQIKAGSKGGRSGQWSARKAQMLARQYKAKGGGYRD